MSIRLLTILVSTLTIVLGVDFVHAQSSGSIAIEKPFSRATPGDSRIGVGYMTIINNGATADRLVSAASPAVAKVQIHEMTMQNGVMKMRELPDGLPVAAGKTLTLAPGGNHLMLMGLKAPLREGDKVPITLNFEKAGKIDVMLAVQGIGAQQPSGMSMPSGDPMHKM